MLLLPYSFLSCVAVCCCGGLLLLLLLMLLLLLLLLLLRCVGVVVFVVVVVVGGGGGMGAQARLAAAPSLSRARTASVDSVGRATDWLFPHEAEARGRGGEGEEEEGFSWADFQLVCALLPPLLAEPVLPPCAAVLLLLVCLLLLLCSALLLCASLRS
jgi:hypothetical protein